MSTQSIIRAVSVHPNLAGIQDSNEYMTIPFHNLQCSGKAAKQNTFLFLFFRVIPCILMSSKSFIFQLIYNRVALKNIKIYIKTAPTYFGLITIIRERII